MKYKVSDVEDYLSGFFGVSVRTTPPGIIVAIMQRRTKSLVFYIRRSDKDALLYEEMNHKRAISVGPASTADLTEASFKNNN